MVVLHTDAKLVQYAMIEFPGDFKIWQSIERIQTHLLVLVRVSNKVALYCMLAAI